MTEVDPGAVNPGSDSRLVWRMPRAGSLTALRLERDPLPPPGDGEARVAVRAVGLNLADVFACLGMYSATPEGPFVPGLEVAGVVEEIGPSRREAGAGTGSRAPQAAGAGRSLSAPVRPGDRVIGLTRFGAYATAVNLDVRYLRPLPAPWSYAEGAAFPVQALTACYAAEDLGRVRPGELVLVHSAAGGVGLNALTLLSALRARVIGTVGSEAKRELLVERGLLPKGQVIVRDRRRFEAQLQTALAALGADGLDLVLDGVAGPFFEPAYRKLRAGGRYVVFGASDFMPRGEGKTVLRLLPRYLNRPFLDPLRMMSANRSVAGFNLIWLWDQLDRLGGLYERATQVLPAPPFVGRAFPFEEAPAALRWLKDGTSVGKVVLENDRP